MSLPFDNGPKGSSCNHRGTTMAGKRCDLGTLCAPEHDGSLNLARTLSPGPLDSSKSQLQQIGERGGLHQQPAHLHSQVSTVQAQTGVLAKKREHRPLCTAVAEGRGRRGIGEDQSPMRDASDRLQVHGEVPRQGSRRPSPHRSGTGSEFGLCSAYEPACSKGCSSPSGTSSSFNCCTADPGVPP